MKMKTERRVLDVIRSEDERLLRSLQEEERLADDEDEAFAYDVYAAHEAPLIAELCLSLLVVVHHQVERELVGMSAKVGAPDESIDLDAYREQVASAREMFRRRRANLRFSASSMSRSRCSRPGTLRWRREVAPLARTPDGLRTSRVE